MANQSLNAEMDDVLSDPYLPQKLNAQQTPSETCHSSDPSHYQHNEYSPPFHTFGEVMD